MSETPLSPKARFILDFAPLGVFFVAFKAADIMAATIALTITTMISLAITYFFEKKLAPTPLISGIAVAVFGVLTVVFDNEQFIKIKPTIVNLLFALILFVGLYLKKPPLRYMLQAAFDLEDEGWNKLTLRWGFFFVFLAALNEYIWRSYSTDFWVDFKVFGMMTLTIAFTFSQIPLMGKYMVLPEHEQKKPETES